MTTFTLSESVGDGGENRPEDVRALKEHLVDLGFDWLTVDGEVDEALKRVVNLVQSMKAGRDVLHGDGRVDVPSPPDEIWTYDWLRAANAPRWQIMPEGEAASGFVNFERADASDNHDFGAGWMAETIRGAGVWYRDQYLADHPDAALLTINDVSVPQGGDTPDHAGHETGLACDIRLPRTDGTAPGATTHEHDEYDQDAMRAMLRAIRAQPRVTRILFNDPDLSAEGLGQRSPGHADHAHFEIAPLLPILDYDEELDSLLQRAVREFGGTVVDPEDYPMTETGFQEYLEDTGIDHFTADEMLTPHHEGVAEGLGYTLFLPPHAWWRRGAALALLSDELRSLVGEAVVMRNWWRPRPYNAHPTVGGAEESDHVTATGVDLDYRSADSRRAAERRLRRLYEGEEWLQLSLGLGNRTTHVGLLSPGRRREWTYDSYVP
ncbi:MAG: peptidoglycan-binding domain-containing protein [Anaerolineales bacterium]